MAKERKVDIGYRPLTELHYKLHCALKRFNVIVAHRRFGKTVLSINELIKRAAQCELKRPQYAYAMPTYAQAKKVAWSYIKEYCGNIPGVRFNESELLCEWPNGVKIYLLGADNPDSHRGMYFDGVVIDEPAQCPKDFWKKIIRPAISDRRGWVIFIGTPNGRDYFYNLYKKALAKKSWFGIRLPVDKTGVFGTVYPLSELEDAKDDMDSPGDFEQEYMCSFDASSEFILIPLDLVETAIGRPVGYTYAPVIAGLDVGVSLDGDPSALVIRQGGKILFAEAFRYREYPKIAGHVLTRLIEHNCNTVCVDAIGWGAGAAQELQKFSGLDVHAINVAESASYEERFPRLRDELWWKCREFFTDKQCCIPENLNHREELIEELTGVSYARTTSDKIKIMSKSEMKKEIGRSPNIADALCLTFSVTGKVFETATVKKPRFLVA